MADIPQHESQEGSFHESLQELRTQLDRMNQRTTAFLLPRVHDPEQHELHDHALALPSGPAFWQLYRALRSDIRGLDARIEHIEDRLEEFSDRLEAVEPPKRTPPESLVNDKHDEASDSNKPCTDPTTPCPYGQPTTDGTRQLPIADVSDVLIFDDTCNDDSSQSSTSDVYAFLARLKQTSTNKSLVHPERFLRGVALQLFKSGWQASGKNAYTQASGELDIRAFEKVLLPAVGPAADDILNKETYTLDDLRSGRDMVKDYALKKLDVGRYLPIDDEWKKLETIFRSIRMGIRVPYAHQSWPKHSGSDNETVAEFLARLRQVQVSLARQHRVHRSEHERPAPCPSGSRYAPSTSSSASSSAQASQRADRRGGRARVLNRDNATFYVMGKDGLLETI